MDEIEIIYVEDPNSFDKKDKEHYEYLKKMR
jgi:hypothetical protein